MRIFVFGNINAGKTYLINELSSIVKGFTVLSIDDYRRKHSSATWESEQKTQELFTSDVENLDNIIVECSGLGPLGIKLASVINIKTDIIIWKKTSLELCIERLSSKDLSLTPYPETTERIEDTIYRCHKEFEEGKLNQIWNEKVMQIITINEVKDLHDIPFNLYSKFSSIVSNLYHNSLIDTIYPFGSFARNQVTKQSDIDCFIVTRLSTQEVVNLLKETSYTFIDTIKNKIVIRYHDKTMIELMVVKRLQDGERYLKGSLIKSPMQSVIKLSKCDEKYIKSLDFENSYPIDSIDTLVSNMMYFVYSLPKLLESDNRYKYYFHFNIILHDYIRINEILNGNIKFNYLPKVEVDNYNHLFVDEFAELFSHFKYLQLHVKELLIKINSTKSNEHLNIFNHFVINANS